ncbi:MAG: PilN domain-containing protein [Chitinispirillales bacterium]|nr:PilN domain-containing protein [Chitinispirillales bacterium]
MIEINLINSPAYVIGNYTEPFVKKTAGIIVVTAIFILIPVFSFFWVQTAEERFADNGEDLMGVMETSQEVKTRTMMDAIVEEIVDPVSKIFPKNAIGNKNYEEMAKWEQINYEVKFTFLLLEAFSKIPPSGVLFNNIRVSDYKLLVADGTAPDKETISTMLSRLKTSEWELLPKPKTSIRDGGSFYYFHIEAEYYPGMKNVIKQPINPDNIPDLPRLAGVKDAVVKAANSAGLKNQGLILEKSQYEPDVKEYVYSIKISGNFNNLLIFFKKLSDINVPIRCSEISIKNNGQLTGNYGQLFEGVVKIIINVR